MKTVVLCGAGGYGQTYVRELLDNGAKYGVCWVGAVEPFPEKLANKAEIDAAGVPWFRSPEDFYRDHGADLCVIASPIGFHASQSILALQNGSHVLCEKPAAALPSDIAAMMSARGKAGKRLLIGYQWSYSDAVLKLKGDIMSGRLGSPLSLRTCVLWPRDRAYFRRCGWAGCVKDSSGHWVLDSVANNAASHYLHNMLYLLGGEGFSALPDTLNAVLMRANPIQMYDTAFLRMALGETLIYFTATHAGEEHGGLVCRFEFENGIVTYNDNERSCFTGILKNGETVEYGDPDEGGSCVLWKVIASLRGERNAEQVCPIEAVTAHNRVVTAALLSAEIAGFPEIRDDGRRFFVDGLNALCRSCYNGLRLPGSSDALRAKPGLTIRLDDSRIDQYGTPGVGDV